MPWSCKYASTPPASPVELEEAKAHLRVTHDDEDTLIARCVEAATRMCEAETHRQFAQTSLVLSLDRLPTGRTPLLLPRAPLATLDSLAYVDAAGTSSTILLADLIVDATSEPGRVQPRYGTYWPTVRDQINAVTVTFTAGYTAALVPDLARAAILLQTGTLYQHREGVVVGTITGELAQSVRDLLMPLVYGDEFTQYGPCASAAEY